jgi:hypothetical protein
MAGLADILNNPEKLQKVSQFLLNFGTGLSQANSQGLSPFASLSYGFGAGGQGLQQFMQQQELQKDRKQIRDLRGLQMQKIEKELSAEPGFTDKYEVINGKVIDKQTLQPIADFSDPNTSIARVPIDNEGTYESRVVNKGTGETIAVLGRGRSQAPETNVTVEGNKYGTIPTGYQLIETPEGARMEPLPGSPAAREIAGEEEAAASQEAAQTEASASKAQTMLDATAGIKEEIKNASLPAVGTKSIPFGLYSETAAGRVRSYVNTLKSGVVLGAMMRLKEASATGATGFGQMNRAELQILIDNLGSLDPDNTSQDIFLKTVDRVENQYKRVVNDIRKNVSPERIKELGLEPLLKSIESGGSNAQDFKAMSRDDLLNLDTSTITTDEALQRYMDAMKAAGLL